MSWIHEGKRAIRFIYLGLLGLAISGPWTYDEINVPAEYTCSPPNIRLEGDFCGLPLSLAWFLTSVAGGFLYIIREVDLGSLRLVSVLRELRVYLYVLLLLFPVVSTAVLVVRGGGRRWQKLHIAGLALATGLAGWLAGMGYFTSGWILWRLWGVCLYICLAASLFVLEAFLWRTPPGSVRESSSEGTAAV